MNVFYEDLPESLRIDGEDYKIITDFREWIRFSDMLKADMPAEYKYEFIKEMFLDDITLNPDTFEDVLKAISSFLGMAEVQLPTKYNTAGKSSSKANISYEYDAPYIISAFLQNYGIDLLEIEYMHWWKFKMLLDGLPEECQIKQRIYYRDVDLSSIKDKAEQKRISKIKYRISLPENEYVSDGDIANAF